MAKQVKQAVLADIRKRKPVTVTSQYTAKDENGGDVLENGEPVFLQFDIVRLSAKGLSAIRQHLDEQGKPTDEEAFQMTLVQYCVASPKLTDAAVQDLADESGVAFADLVAQISTVNGFSQKAREEARRTFPDGAGEPSGPPAGS